LQHQARPPEVWHPLAAPDKGDIDLDASQQKKPWRPIIKAANIKK
jgi:hypothetical protein